MTEHITVRGFVGNETRLITTEKGLPIATLRVASTLRRFNRDSGEWENGETNWYSVTCFRQLALNVHSTVNKGDPVVVSGRLRIRPWENESGQRGTNVEIDADGVGHDLTFGTGSFMRLGGGGSSGQSTPGSSSTHSAGDEPQGPDAAWGTGGLSAEEAEESEQEPAEDPAWDEADQKEPAF